MSDILVFQAILLMTIIMKLEYHIIIYLTDAQSDNIKWCCCGSQGWEGELSYLGVSQELDTSHCYEECLETQMHLMEENYKSLLLKKNEDEDE